MSIEQFTQLVGSGNPNREKDDFYATPDWAIKAKTRLDLINRR